MGTFDIFKNDAECDFYALGSCFINFCDGTVQIGQSDDINFSSPMPVNRDLSNTNLYKRWLEGSSRTGYYSDPFQIRFKEVNSVVNFGYSEGTVLDLLKVPFQENTDDSEGICVSFKMTNLDGDVKYATYLNNGSLNEMQSLFSSDLSYHDVAANAGDFIIMKSFDETELRILDFFSGMMHPTVIEIKDEGVARKLNFALSRVKGSMEKYRLIACTYDARWNNTCRMFPISVLPLQSRISVGTEFAFSMAEGMCAHQIVLTDEYIVFSCSKMFEDGSARKVRILSTTARDDTRMKPMLIAEQSTPVYESVMVSPQDEITVLHHSETETDVLYAVGSTIVDIKLVADASNVAWRTSINVANLCDEMGMLTVSSTDSVLVVGAHGKNYFVQMCGYHEVLSSDGMCMPLSEGRFSLENVKYMCSARTTDFTHWGMHIK